MKIEEQVLSREQMAHLSELGVDTSDASMIWLINKDNPSIMSVEINDLLPYVGYCSCDIIATYTIGDLIKKLPKIIGFEFSCASYRYERNNFAAIRYQLLHTHDADLKEDLYKALCWVAENHKELIE